MQINQLEIADTTFGKFVGCAVMSERQYLPEYDLSNLELKITLDGKELDPRKVFSAWERAAAGPAEITRAPEPPPRHDDGPTLQVQRSDLRDALQDIRDSIDEMSSADSYVSDTYDNIINAIDRALRNAVREALNECVNENSTSEPNYEATRRAESAADTLDRLLGG